MASLRKLNRRLARWQRYARRYGYPSPALLVKVSWDQPLPGHTRAWSAREKEVERRFWDETPEVWLGDERALLADVLDDEFFCGDSGCSCGDEPDEDAGHGDDWTVVTVDTGGLT